MKQGFRLVPVLLLAGLVGACGGSSATSPSQPSTGMSALARSYLDQILGIMQANSINRSKIEWSLFRSSVYAAAGNSQAIADTYGAISAALGLLGDHHSYYLKPDGSGVYNPSPRGGCSDAVATTPQVPSAIGYVRVGGFSGSGSLAVDFAASIQSQIRSADNDDVQGWIVDLRGNGGGNMWPMIAGLGPVLGEGQAGAFIDPNGQVTTWGYAGGASISGSPPATAIQVPAPYQLVRPGPRVAVLTDCRVASSGEATAIAFRGRANTRSFGTATYGLSTANRGFPLTDGATLILTVSVMADRNLTPYGDIVVPDEIITTPDQTVARAIEWLRGASMASAF
jgi:carboxyl-terminal processing protease